jgi:SAM-dependent methyltransferase
MNRIRDHFDRHVAWYDGRGKSQSEEIWRYRRPLFQQFLDPAAPLIRILDVGGGSGFLADRLLAEFPNTEVTIVDISQRLLDQNQPHDRKRLVCEDFQSFLAHERSTYDVINFDVMLHHVLTPKSFLASRKMQSQVIALAVRALRPGGLISIREIAYQTLRGLPRHTSHWLLWFLSTRSLPEAMQRVMHRLGMRSQGAGVCFSAIDDLVNMLKAQGLTVEAQVTHRFATMNLKYRLTLAADVVDIYLMARTV